jgi:flavin reductase (DIM6/NTAB) family NADH-FMN oxidoreductase RutF
LENKDFTMLWSNFDKIINRLSSQGILLVSGDGKNKDNIMTIGWAQFGISWQSPSVNILVRPSRFSYNLLTNNSFFSVNILSEKYNNEINFCGKNSGSYCDKFQETKFTKTFSKNFNVPSIKESDISLECQIVHSTEVIPENLNDLFLTKFYSNGDYHTIFTGTILNYKINV